MSVITNEWNAAFQKNFDAALKARKDAAAAVSGGPSSGKSAWTIAAEKIALERQAAIGA